MQSAIDRYFKGKKYSQDIMHSRKFPKIHRRITLAAISNSFSKDS